MTQRRSYYVAGLAKASLVTLIIITLAGGTVRITGSGMGCPDWPKCFGMIIPPTHVSQLPSNYQVKYAAHGYGSTEFNVTKTWIEYLNRMVSVIGGFVILAWLVSSIRYPTLAILILSILILMGFEAWLGKQVVSSNLAPQKVTIHLMVAFLILLLACFALYKSLILHSTLPLEVPILPLASLVAIWGLLVVQLYLGTRVRSEVDLAIVENPTLPRQLWESFSSTLNLHRPMSIIIAILGFWIAIKAWLRGFPKYAVGILALIGGQILGGTVLTEANYPAIAQLIHLALAILLFTLLSWMLVVNIMKRKSFSSPKSLVYQ